MPSLRPLARNYRQVSFWMDSLGEEIVPRASLSGDHSADVAIVGAGYTGLWTAYYLAQLAPGARIVILESEVAGFGASGRNGGWCSARFAASDARLARDHGADAMHAMVEAMQETVDEVGRVAADEGIDCDFRKAGTVTGARSPAQVGTLRSELAEARRLGVPEADLRWCEADEITEMFGASELLGGLFTPHCASIHPARLCRGLADVVEHRGAELHEQSPVLSIAAAGDGTHSITTPSGRLRAKAVVIATEGYTPELEGHGREVVPLYSLMVATEPLGEERLSRIGSALQAGATFNDARHLIIYGQVTKDGRLAFGGRGAPYHFSSRVRDRFEHNGQVHAAIEKTIAELFPALGPLAITHRWGGPIGIHRDWFPSVSFDRRSGIASAGGYVGDGVATTNLAGRTLADLILGRESELVSLPWVGHKSPPWEHEPLRYLGVNAGLRVMQAADSLEKRSGRPSRLARMLAPLIGD